MKLGDYIERSTRLAEEIFYDLQELERIYRAYYGKSQVDTSMLDTQEACDLALLLDILLATECITKEDIKKVLRFVFEEDVP